jgi:Kef-type K+ transport system membrane component KefB
VFFVTTGIRLLAEPVASSPWVLLPALLLLAMMCKVAGTYLGRLAGLPRANVLRAEYSDHHQPKPACYL